MDLPSFLWLWKIAAWSMGLSVTAYFLLAVSGGWLFYGRSNKKKRPQWLRSLHITIGSILVGLVLLLLGIGVVGTLGHYGSLGHSSHLIAGTIVVALVLASAASASRIHPKRPWARQLHVSINLVLLFGFMWVSWTGWSVVQKYL
jgi:ABC-type tungstate transport system substrate-binding protein